MKTYLNGWWVPCRCESRFHPGVNRRFAPQKFQGGDPVDFFANGTWLVAVHEMVEYHLLDVIVSVFTRAWTLVRNARNARRGAVLTFNLWCGWSPSEK